MPRSTHAPYDAGHAWLTQSRADAAAAAGSRYKKYVALLTQTGTSAPVATVLENTLGGTVVWTRAGEGYYTATLAAAFPLAKTTIQIQPSAMDRGFGAGNNEAGTPSSELYVETGTLGVPADGLINTQYVEIRVYL